MSVRTGTFLYPGEVLEVERGQLGATEGAGITRQQQCPVAGASQVRGQVGEDLEQVGGEQGRLALLGGP